MNLKQPFWPSEDQSDLKSQLEEVLNEDKRKRNQNDDSDLLEKSKQTLHRLRAEFSKLSTMQFTELSASRRRLAEMDQQVCDS